MNYSAITYIIGWLLNFEAIFMTLPCLVAAIYGEESGWVFVITIFFCLLLGIPRTVHGLKNKVIQAREGFVTVALGWIIMSIMGAVPFVLSGAIPNWIDAVFETVSGFTTTGASILSDVEILDRCLLFWRSFTHWIGGMGVLVFILSVLPLRGGYHMNLMRAESPGPSVSKLVPRTQSTAKILYGIYIALTLLEILLLLLGGMPVFDALTTSFGTAGTGGFGIKNDSIASYSPYLQNVITIFMILFGVNFNLYFLLLIRKPKQALRSEELRGYLSIIAVTILVITFEISRLYGSIWDALRHASFQVASIITTTGFATTDFNLWPEVPRTTLIMLMFVGACAGSTGGGIKVSRFLILLKSLFKELHQYVHPTAVRKIKLDGRPVEHEVVRSVNVFMVMYILVFSLSVLLVGFDGKDLITNFTAVAATLNNIGPGLELVGPTQNFGGFSDGSKLVLIFDMLAGRLELFPLLMLFHPKTWKRF